MFVGCPPLRQNRIHPFVESSLSSKVGHCGTVCGMSNGMKTRPPFYRSSSIPDRVLHLIVNIFVFHSELARILIRQCDERQVSKIFSSNGSSLCICEYVVNG